MEGVEASPQSKARTPYRTNTRCKAALMRSAENAGVVANGDFQGRGILAQMALGPHQKGRRDGFHHFVGERYRLAGALHRHAADVRAAFQFAVIHKRFLLCYVQAAP